MCRSRLEVQTVSTKDPVIRLTTAAAASTCRVCYASIGAVCVRRWAPLRFHTVWCCEMKRDAHSRRTTWRNKRSFVHLACDESIDSGSESGGRTGDLQILSWEKQSAYSSSNTVIDRHIHTVKRNKTKQKNKQTNKKTTTTTTTKNRERERERERDRQIDRQTDRQTETERQIVRKRLFWTAPRLKSSALFCFASLLMICLMPFIYISQGHFCAVDSTLNTADDKTDNNILRSNFQTRKCQ